MMRNTKLDDICHIEQVLIMERCQIDLAGINRFLSQPCFKVGQRLTSSMVTDLPVKMIGNKSDLVIMELSGENESALDGLRVIGQLTSAWPPTPLIVCTALTDVRLLGQLATLGVSGIYIKTEPLSALTRCVQRVMQKEFSYSPEVIRRIGHGSQVRLLTPREIDVLKCLFSGLNVTETAISLGRDIRTISSHKRSAMDKLSFSNDYEFYSWGNCYGLPL